MGPGAFNAHFIVSGLSLGTGLGIDCFIDFFRGGGSEWVYIGPVLYQSGGKVPCYPGIGP
jgi:hypothetical protein